MNKINLIITILITHIVFATQGMDFKKNTPQKKCSAASIPVIGSLIKKYQQAIAPHTPTKPSKSTGKTYFIEKTASNPPAHTVEAHTCNIIGSLLSDLSRKNLEVSSIKSCKIQIPEREDKNAIKKILKRKYPTIKEVTFIEYTTDLPDKCLARLEARITPQPIMLSKRTYSAKL